MTHSETSMIRWKLREFMARHKVSNRQLGKEIGKHEGSISRLKQPDSMPRVDGETLNSLCHGLTRCLEANGIKKADDSKVIVTPYDLIEFSYDGDPPEGEKNKQSRSTATTKLTLKDTNNDNKVTGLIEEAA